MSQRILILAANPKDTTRLSLDQEAREIYAGLQRARHRERFILEQRWAVRPRDIQRAMLDFNPQIVHFSGHGTGDEGLVFEDETGSPKLVDGLTLAGLFNLFADQVECIVLNGCYSQMQAEAISQHINYVIGMSKAIEHKAAIEFAVDFYDTLGSGRSVEFAYKIGCAAIRLAGIPEQLIPTLKEKPFNGSKNQLPIPNEPAFELDQELKDSDRELLTDFKKGKYAIVFACGGAFLGSLTGNIHISIIGTIIGGIYGFMLNDSSKSDLNNNFLSHKITFSKDLFKRGEHMIALASGGAFLGGIIAQIPGSIIGALAGAIFSLFRGCLKSYRKSKFKQVS